MNKALVLPLKVIRQELKGLPGWNYAKNIISKEFKFVDFMDALDFVNKLAPICEQNDHHPDIHVYYSKIAFELQRFDVGGKVTDKDIYMAREIEELYKGRN